jgi:hypothetical protein
MVSVKNWIHGICAKYLQYPLIYEAVIDRPITDYVNLSPLGVTLTLEVGMQVLRIAHHLIFVTICAKYFQVFSKSIDL